MSRSFPYDFPETGYHAPSVFEKKLKSTMDNTDIEIAPIPKGVLLTYSLINELTGEYQRLGRTLSPIEADTIIQRHKMPPKPREWFGEVLPSGNLLIHNNKHSLTAGGEFIHVKEVVPEPEAKEWWFVKTRYDGPWWRRCDEKQSDPENHKTQIHVREIP